MEDEKYCNLTAICIVGNSLQDDLELINDAMSFGLKVIFSR